MKNLFLSFLLLFSTPLCASPKVVVVGAGLAGLTTAYRLQQKGFDVDVYEARHRVGGRVFSVNVEGHAGELGAENISDGGEVPHMLALIEEMGLKTQARKSPIRLYYFEKGAFQDVKALIREHHFAPEELNAQLQLLRERTSTMREVLDTLLSQEDLLYKVLCVTLAAYEGAPVDKLSSIYVETLYHQLSGGFSATHPSEGEETYFSHLWIQGGNGHLVEKLAEKLSGHVFLDHPLQAVAKSPSGSYLLTFQNEYEVEADILVLTMPCPVYADLAIEDQVIDRERQKAIQSIQYGTNGKIVVPIETKDPMGAHINGRAITFLNEDLHGLNVYYTGYHGEFCEENLEETFQQELPMIEAVYTLKSSEKPVMASDELFALYKGPVAHCWLTDPYAKGSYSCIGPGQEALFTSTTTLKGETVKILFAPIDNTLFFAGEHTSILFEASATMEAAVESGERTARLIVQYLKDAPVCPAQARYH